MFPTPSGIIYSGEFPPQLTRRMRHNGMRPAITPRVSRFVPYINTRQSGVASSSIDVEGGNNHRTAIS